MGKRIPLREREGASHLATVRGKLYNLWDVAGGRGRPAFPAYSLYSKFELLFVTEARIKKIIDTVISENKKKIHFGPIELICYIKRVIKQLLSAKY